MAGTPANARVWINADVYVAPLGTTAPTDVATAWAAAWKVVGLLSEEGMTEAREDDSTDHYAWGSILIRTTRSKHKRSFVVAVLEDGLTVQGIVNPGSTSVTSAGPTPPAGTVTRTIRVPGVNIQAFGFQFADGTVTRRIAIPRGEVVEVGDVTYSDADLYMRELTINVLPASDGTLYTEITNDAQAGI